MKLNKKKTSFNTNAFYFNTLNEDYGLDERITIKPIHIQYDTSFKSLMAGKTTPSNLLKGTVELSSGTKEALKRKLKMVPQIDYSYIDPQYYEHKMEGKSNKDFILEKLTPNTSGKDFTKKIY